MSANRALSLQSALVLTLCVAASVHGEAPPECSWKGPEPSWLLARTLPRAGVAGTLGDLVDLLHEDDLPVSFVARPGDDAAVRIERPAATSAGELIETALAQSPGYRLGVVGGRLVLYPRDEAYDAVVELGAIREAARGNALASVLSELRAKVPELEGLAPPTLRGPSLSVYRDPIPFGGARTVVEHLVSLIAGRPSAAFLVRADAGGARSFDIKLVDLIDGLRLEVPDEVEVGTEFEVIPRASLSGGGLVSLRGPGCGVRYEATPGSVLEIDPEGRARALERGLADVVVWYEGWLAQAEVRVK